MASLITYKLWLQVVSPDPTEDGGLAIHNNFKKITDIIRKPTSGGDQDNILIENATVAKEIRIQPDSVNTLVSDINRSYLYRIAGADPIDNTTGLDSKKMAFESRLWDSAAAQSRFGNIRFEDVSGTNDQGQFTLSSTDNGGSENDFLKIRRDSSGNLLIQPASGEALSLHGGDGDDIFKIQTDNKWQLIDENGVTVQLENFGGTTLRFGANVIVKNGLMFSFGTSSEYRWTYNTFQTNDCLFLGMVTGAAQTLIISEQANAPEDFGFAKRTEPAIYFHDGIPSPSFDETDGTFVFQQGDTLMLETGDGTSANTKLGTTSASLQVLGSAFPKAHFYADQLDNPNSADWKINALAPAVADSNNSGLTSRLFDDTTEEGVGFIITVPADATNLKLSIKSRAETGPGAAKAVVPKIYNRGIPDNAAVEAWSAGTNLTAVDLPITTEFFQYDTQTITLSSLGITVGELTQFEITRVGTDGSDTLTGDWALLEIIVEFT